MQTIKRGTTPTLKIKCENIDLTIIDHIDFIFKLFPSENKKAKIKKRYPDDVQFDEGEKIFYLPLTEAETRLLPSEGYIYWDTKPVTNDGKILNTGEPKSFKMFPTLFSGGTE